MTKNEDYAFVWNVLKHEGLFSDREDDRGGKTFRGVTWETYSAWMKTKALVPTHDHHEAMNEDELLAIYLDAFVTPLKIMFYDSAWVREAIFSASMNHGGRNASKMVQRAAKANLIIDGIIGPATLKAVNSTYANAFVNNLTKERIIFTDKIVRRDVLTGGKSQVTNLVGWHIRYLRFIKPQ